MEGVAGFGTGRVGRASHLRRRVDKNKQTMTIPARPGATNMTGTNLSLLHRCNCAADAGARRWYWPSPKTGPLWLPIPEIIGTHSGNVDVSDSGAQQR